MITLESLSQSPFSFDLAELNDKTLQRKVQCMEIQQQTAVGI